jgi:hypothetical protein
MFGWRERTWRGRGAMLIEFFTNPVMRRRILRGDFY